MSRMAWRHRTGWMMAFSCDGASHAFFYPGNKRSLSGPCNLRTCVANSSDSNSVLVLSTRGCWRLTSSKWRTLQSRVSMFSFIPLRGPKQDALRWQAHALWPQQMVQGPLTSLLERHGAPVSGDPVCLSGKEETRFIAAVSISIIIPGFNLRRGCSRLSPKR